MNCSYGGGGGGRAAGRAGDVRLAWDVSQMFVVTG